MMELSSGIDVIDKLIDKSDSDAIVIVFLQLWW